jgi:ABC-type Fe3+/spermidine/putrescine transport system ATPase subunit
LVQVSLEHVFKVFGKVSALQDVNIQVSEGELFLILGPSGCGKTTALRIVAGFYKPDSGLLRFDGTTVNDVPPYKRNIGMVFQNYALWPHMSVYENVAFGLKMRKVATNDRVERVRKVLDLVKMREYADRFPNQLSGGQQQRIALARALVIEPSVLLLDEPLSNLDAKLRMEMRGEIRRIHRELGITTVYVTHDQSEALAIADRIAVMNIGRVAQVGEPREIYQNPQSPFVAGFMGESNTLSGQIKTINKTTGTALIDLEGNFTLEGHLPKDFSAYSAGDSVKCFIRVGSIFGNPANGQKIQAKVLSLTYHGEEEYYELELPSGEFLRAMRFNPTGIPLSVGETVIIPLPPANIKLLKEPE